MPAQYGSRGFDWTTALAPLGERVSRPVGTGEGVVFGIARSPARHPAFPPRGARHPHPQSRDFWWDYSPFQQERPDKTDRIRGCGDYPPTETEIVCGRGSWTRTKGFVRRGPKTGRPQTTIQQKASPPPVDRARFPPLRHHAGHLSIQVAAVVRLAIFSSREKGEGSLPVSASVESGAATGVNLPSLAMLFAGPSNKRWP